jgi:hypothetical protein
MQPGPGETALTLELGVVAFAVGLLVLFVIIGKLVWEWWRNRGEDESGPYG